jgi:hypothetical protein
MEGSRAQSNQGLERRAEIGMPPGTHSHQVRVSDGMMLVDHRVRGFHILERT